MENLPRNILIIAAVVVSLLGALSFYYARQDYNADSIIFDTDKNIAIYGYDTVAYFNEDKALRGDPKYQVEWAGSTWYFINIKNRDTFANKPENYAPQFGGYDPSGISEGYTHPTDPTIFTVFAGQLFLHHSEEFKKHWNDNRGQNMILATSNWPFIRNRLLGKE